MDEGVLEIRRGLADARLRVDDEVARDRHALELAVLAAYA